MLPLILVLVCQVQGTSEIFQIIQQLAEGIRSEDSVHDQLFRGRQLDCKSELDYRSNELENADYSLTKAQSEFQNCDTLFEYAKTRVTHLVSAKQEITQVTELANAVKAQALAAQQESIALHEFIRGFDETQDTLKQSALTLEQTYSPLEVEMIANLEQLITELFTQASDTAHQVSTLDNLAVSMDDCRKAQQNKIFQASDTKSRNVNMKQRTGTICQDWKEQYEAQTASRNKQLDLLGQLEDLAHAKFGPMQVSSSLKFT